MGLIEPARTASGYRIFGPGELQRLRTLRELLARFELRPLRRRVRDANARGGRACARRVESWFEEEPERPAESRRRRLAPLGAGEARALLLATQLT